MNNRQYNKFRQFVASETTLKSNKVLFISNVKFISKMTAYFIIIEAIRIKTNQQATSTKGKVIARDDGKSGLIASLIAGIGALYVLAEDKHDEVLKANASIPDSELWHCPFEELNNLAAFFIKLIEANMLDLPEHGYTQEDLDELKAKADAFSSSQGSTYQGMALQKAATVTLPQLIDEADAALKALDRYVKIVARKFPDFAQEYWATRVIKDLGIRHEKKEEVQTPQQ